MEMGIKKKVFQVETKIHGVGGKVRQPQVVQFG